VLHIVIAALIGVGVGYGFRGLINREGKKVEAAASADASKVAAEAAKKL